MRKRLIDPLPRPGPLEPEWLELERLAQIELTSEDPAFPIETAFLPGSASGWRAALPGEQTIRVIFDQPQRLQRIRLAFVETEVERSQEFTLRWSPDGGVSFRKIVRQQWNFNPADATREDEDFRVELSGVTVLELTIVPDRSGGGARASLSELRLA